MLCGIAATGGVCSEQGDCRVPVAVVRVWNDESLMLVWLSQERASAHKHPEIIGKLFTMLTLASLVCGVAPRWPRVCPQQQLAQHITHG